MVEAVLTYIGVRRHLGQRVSVVSPLRDREALAEERAEAALNELRAVRLEYDPRERGSRQQKLDSIHARIERQQAHIATLKEGLAHG